MKTRLQDSIAGEQMAPITYLLSEYPAVSHTFFLNEVLSLRLLGLEIETASINSSREPADGFSDREKEEAARTFYIKAAKRSAILMMLIRTLLFEPGVILRGVRATLKLAPWNFAATGYGFFYLLEALILGNAMRERRSGHLHVHFTGPVATVAMLASIAWKFPYSFMAHGPEEFYNIDAFYLRDKIKSAKFAFCISDFCRSQLLRVISSDSWHKIHVCRLGVDDAVFFPGTPPAEQMRLVSVGRLHPSKGHLILLEAILALKRQGVVVSLDIVGGGPGRAELEEFIEANSLGGQVNLLGALSHAGTKRVLERAHIFVLASFAEGVPVALMEAMAMEIACVSTYVAGISELICNGKDGLLVAPSSVEELTKALLELIANPQLRMELARSGRATVLKRYNLRTNTLHLAQTFRRCMELPA